MAKKSKKKAFTKHVAFGGRMVMIGFGSIGQGVLPLIFRHIDIKHIHHFQDGYIQLTSIVRHFSNHFVKTWSSSIFGCYQFPVIFCIMRYHTVTSILS